VIHPLCKTEAIHKRCPKDPCTFLGTPPQLPEYTNRSTSSAPRRACESGRRTVIPCRGRRAAMAGQSRKTPRTIADGDRDGQAPQAEAMTKRSRLSLLTLVAVTLALCEALRADSMAAVIVCVALLLGWLAVLLLGRSEERAAARCVSLNRRRNLMRGLSVTESDKPAKRYGYSVAAERIRPLPGGMTHIATVTRMRDRKLRVDIPTDEFGETYGQSAAEAEDWMIKKVDVWIASQEQ
jgi:hypothetical protein